MLISLVSSSTYNQPLTYSIADLRYCLVGACGGNGTSNASGTVTSISQGEGILASPNPITATGTIAIDYVGFFLARFFNKTEITNNYVNYSNLAVAIGNSTINRSINLSLYNYSINLNSYNQSLNLSLYNYSINLNIYNQSVNLSLYNYSVNLDAYNKSINLSLYNTSVSLSGYQTGNEIYNCSAMNSCANIVYSNNLTGDAIGITFINATNQYIIYENSTGIGKPSNISANITAFDARYQTTSNASLINSSITAALALKQNEASAFKIENQSTIGTGSVNGTGTSGYIAMWNSTTSINNSVMYQSGSNIGINTVSPSTTLNINGTTNTTSLVVTNSTTFIMHNPEIISNDSKAYIVTVYNSGAGTDPQMVLRKAGCTIASPCATPNSASLGSFSFRGYDGNEFTGSKAYIVGAAEAAWNTTQQPTRLIFSTTNMTTLTEAMRIDRLQRVIIGTNAATGNGEKFYHQHTRSETSNSFFTSNLFQTQLESDGTAIQGTRIGAWYRVLMSNQVAAMTGTLYAQYNEIGTSGSSTGLITTGIATQLNVRTMNNSISTAIGARCGFQLNDRGNFTNAYCIYAQRPYANTVGATGNITNFYASFYSEDVSSLRASNTFAFYSQGASKSYFGGNTGFNTTNPSYPLEVNGNVRFNEKMFGIINNNTWIDNCTMVAGSCTINNNMVTSRTKFNCDAQNGFTTPAYMSVTSVTSGTSYVVTSTNGASAGEVSCTLIEV